MKLLIINICELELHYDEFVRPIFDICKKITNDIKVFNYLNLDVLILNDFDKIIICGTALKDFNYLKNLNKFLWIKSTPKSILGICGGAQIIANAFRSYIKSGSEIGMTDLKIIENDKLFDKLIFSQVYCMHNNYFTIPNNFKLLAKTKYPQIIKKNNSLIYGILFHPEVRYPQLIINFLNL